MMDEETLKLEQVLSRITDEVRKQLERAVEGTWVISYLWDADTVRINIHLRTYSGHSWGYAHVRPTRSFNPKMSASSLVDRIVSEVISALRRGEDDD